MSAKLKSWIQRLRTTGPADERYWFTRYAKSLIFLILVLAMAGAYLAFTIPISVFPTTDFPRVVIGVDNGVMPIDQMMVTITRPIEESVNSVPGLQQVRSITSRGSAEIDLFFDWHENMVTTLQLVDAALSQHSHPAAADRGHPNPPPELRQLSHHRLQPDLRHGPADAALDDGDLRSEAAAQSPRRRGHRGGARRAGAGVPHHSRSRQVAGGQRHRQPTFSTRCAAPT